MGYSALAVMKDKNSEAYGVESSACIPDMKQTAKKYGNAAISFIRDTCADMKFDMTDEKRRTFSDSDGRSSGKNQIPFNMERDLDRMSFENAISRFLLTGSREDAFDIYYCYCEIFKPFGAGYDSAGLLLEMLSEHETNASSLLMKHRDHYSHSVYAFVIGLAIYEKHSVFRASYNARYGLTDGKEAACHFLEFWGLTSLFHDIGYPFEIAHQQMKAYVCKLDKSNNDDSGFSPYISYKNMDKFALSPLGDLNDFFAKAITECLAKYLKRINADPYNTENRLRGILKDRAIHEDPDKKDYLYMDHAYFSGLMLAKTYLSRHSAILTYGDFPEAVRDAFCAVILHNSLFKFTLRSVLHTELPLSLIDGQPLSYLLMLCDELQCWDRASYGQNSRSSIFAYDFDMEFPEEGGMRWKYFYDSAYEDKVLKSKSYNDMLPDGYRKKSGAVREGRSKFVDDIDEIVSIKDVVPGFEPDVKKHDTSGIISVEKKEKQKKTGIYLSDSSYLNLYNFALALNGRYCGAETEDEMKRAFEENLSLEYKLSNIAQAKGFASQLEKIFCFYTSRAVDYEAVTEFTGDELMKIAESEHERWCSEKLDMGWRFGTGHVKKLNGKDDSIMRERTRLHHDLVPFFDLPDVEARKDTEAMKKMMELIREFDGFTIYRMK